MRVFPRYLEHSDAARIREERMVEERKNRFLVGIWNSGEVYDWSPLGYGSKLNHQGTAGVGPCFSFS